MLERGDLARRSEARARQLSLHIANLGRGPVTVTDLSGVAEAEEDVLQVELLDANGQRLVETAPPPKGTWPIIWGTAPTHLTDGAQATVRVAVTEPELIGRDLFLLAIFGLLGTFLTLALYFFPLRLFREEDLVRLFARRSIKAVEEERLRLSRELHDGIAQSMGAVAVAVARAQQRTGPSPELADGARLVDAALHELRRVTQGLRPTSLDDLGLGPAVEELLREAADGGLSVKAEVPVLPRLSPELEHTCYRLVQEALTNVSRHAQAKNLRVSLRRAASELVVEIEDDGRGFSPTSQLGLGLVGARERAAAISGTVTIDSTPGKGTRIRAVLPLLERRSMSSDGLAWAAAQDEVAREE